MATDCDKSTPNRVVKPYAPLNSEVIFLIFPDRPGVVNANVTHTGDYILPDNASPGVLDTLLCECGQILIPRTWRKLVVNKMTYLVKRGNL